jgi:hypothetical protein
VLPGLELEALTRAPRFGLASSNPTFALTARLAARSSGTPANIGLMRLDLPGRIYLVLVGAIVTLAIGWALLQDAHWANAWIPSLTSSLVAILLATAIVDRALEQDRSRRQASERLPMRRAAAGKLANLLSRWKAEAVNLPIERSAELGLSGELGGFRRPPSPSWLTLWLQGVANAPGRAQRHAFRTAERSFDSVRVGLESIQGRYGQFFTPLELIALDQTIDDLEDAATQLAIYYNLHPENPDTDCGGLEWEDFEEVLPTYCRHAVRNFGGLVVVADALAASDEQ